MTYGWRMFGAVAIIACVIATAPAGTEDGPLSPIVVAPVPQQAIVPVKGSDGRYHVLYELQLTNTLDAAADLREVEVRDSASGQTLLKLDAGDIVKGAYLHTLDRRTASDTVFGPFQSRVLILNLDFASKDDIPRALIHRFEISGPDPFTKLPGTFAYRGGAMTISDRAPPVLSPPLEGEGWLASDGCCGPTGHINALIGLEGQIQGSERFAIDWIKIDRDGRIFNGDKSKPESWVGYGSRVLAVGDGVVTVARDDQENQTAGKMPSGLAFAAQLGNYVALALPGGLTAFYAHLAPGSVKVKAGDHVKAGEVIGLLGNTGGTLAPHLHFHIVNGPEVATSDGYPYVLRAFAVAGQVEDEALAASLEGKPGFPPRDAIKPEPREGELPLNFNIVDFPKGE
jgi:Peptidase family M23